MTATDLDRKVRQHENDISATYTVIADIQNTQRRHTNRFNELTEDVGALDGRMSALETRMSSMETRMSSLEGKVDSLEGKVDSLATQIAQVLDLLKR
jgi:predicted  nucleic acid-binding Zn-ribbon protein